MDKRIVGAAPAVRESLQAEQALKLQLQAEALARPEPAQIRKRSGPDYGPSM
ncbi:hypothetical protein [Xenorhabdus bovienii]|uniref:Uncharacterized protein n=1 Tax=Xenorhabdus bovienii TaxID=40576 RepID=A0A0B6XEW4_XENBV|nr:hypothetical protein [Xenorhabdus bovienii]MCG3462889.1 hypothetical protein [Xenorhabdus bovienii]MCG3472284.1 hypothetical protein [Xenorhabdus bovienii]CDM91706.1 protein of unknown function [Xenorhabdus bovienii]